MDIEGQKEKLKKRELKKLMKEKELFIKYL
jgi:hypothetical protein